MNYWEPHIMSWSDREYVHPDDPRFMLTWEWIDEGFNGEYDEDDPDDAPLLRFTVYEWKAWDVPENDITGEWEQAEDASYCTENPIDTDAVYLDDMAREILDEYRRCVLADASPKKVMERCSWITPTRGAKA